AVIAIMILGLRAALVAHVPLTKSPQVLADHAREILRTLGYESENAHRAFGLDYYQELAAEVQQKDRSPRRWSSMTRARPALIDFWYRQGPWPLVTLAPDARVTYTDPPFMDPWMMNVRLDPL